MWYALLLVAVVLLDQLSKIFIAACSGVAGSLSDGGKHICWIIKDFLEITYCENSEGMMGLFPKVKNIVFIIATFVILIGIIIYMLKSKHRGKWINSSLMLIMGGAIGNLIDRIITVYVRDFIHVIIKINGKEIFPFVFNIADIALGVGAIMLIIYILFISDESLFRHKKDKDEIKVTGNTDKADSSAEPAEEK